MEKVETREMYSSHVVYVDIGWTVSWGGTKIDITQRNSNKFIHLHIKLHWYIWITLKNKMVNQFCYVNILVSYLNNTLVNYLNYT